jgi:hypothetical protein
LPGNLEDAYLAGIMPANWYFLFDFILLKY